MAVRDVNEQARGQLDAVIKESESSVKEHEDDISVEEALQERPLLSYDSGRDKTRVLFVTNDTTFLNPVDDALERFFSIADYFDEMHIMVLRSGTMPTKPVLRVRENIWVYIASAENWWWTPVIAYEVVAENQLVFAGGFRPDLVVALEPFEAGLAAQWIGQKYNRPVQIHVRRNFCTEYFRQESRSNRWRRWMAWWVLRRAPSVRVATNQIKQAIASWCATDAIVSLLPRFNNFEAIRDAVPTHDVHDTYPMYEKILLFIGPLSYGSSLYGLIDVIKFVLANPRVGLIVLGDGPEKAECEKKFASLGLSTQVVFPKRIGDIESYLKTSDVLVVTDTTATADEIALQGAVATIPTIMLHTEVRHDYFVDGQNAYICPEDPDCFIQKFHEIVHNEEIRSRFRSDLQKTVVPHLAADASVYQEQYRNSIEHVFLETDLDDVPETEPASSAAETEGESDLEAEPESESEPESELASEPERTS